MDSALWLREHERYPGGKTLSGHEASKLPWQVEEELPHHKEDLPHHEEEYGPLISSLSGLDTLLGEPVANYSIEGGEEGWGNAGLWLNEEKWPVLQTIHWKRVWFAGFKYEFCPTLTLICLW